MAEEKNDVVRETKANKTPEKPEEPDYKAMWETFANWFKGAQKQLSDEVLTAPHPYAYIERNARAALATTVGNVILDLERQAGLHK